MEIKVNNINVEIIDNGELSNDIEFIQSYLEDKSVFSSYREKVPCFRKILKLKNNYDSLDYKHALRDIWYNVGLNRGALYDLITNVVNNNCSYLDTLINSIKGARNGEKAHNLKNFISKYNDTDNVNANVILDYICNTYCKEYSYYLLSNDILDIATCSYKKTYSSCYNISDGAYNNSVNYIINDNLYTDSLMWCVLYQLNIDNLDNLELSQEKLYNIAINRKFTTYDTNNKTLILGANYGNKEFNSYENLTKILHCVIFNDNLDNYLYSSAFESVYYNDNKVKCYHDYTSNSCTAVYNRECEFNLELWCNDYSTFIDIDIPCCADCGDLLANEDCRYWSEYDNCYYCDSCCFYDNVLDDYLGYSRHTRYDLDNTTFSDVSLENLER